LSLEIKRNGKFGLVHSHQRIDYQIQGINPCNGFKQRLMVEIRNKWSGDKQDQIYQYAYGNIDIEHCTEIRFCPVLVLDECTGETAVNENLG
jgi:hypothetical protein